jgi:hypothetical protein
VELEEAATLVLKVRVTGDPLRVTHMMGGSLPMTSEVKVPPLAVTLPAGMVTGMGEAQVLALAVTTTDVILLPS